MSESILLWCMIGLLILSCVIMWIDRYMRSKKITDLRRMSEKLNKTLDKIINPEKEGQERDNDI